jgi:hypothetical protein
LDRRLGGLQSRPRCCGEEKNLAPPGIKPGYIYFHLPYFVLIVFFILLYSFNVITIHFLFEKVVLKLVREALWEPPGIFSAGGAVKFPRGETDDSLTNLYSTRKEYSY